MIKELEFYKTQYEFIVGKETQSLFIAGIGAGKTLAGSVKSLMHAKPRTLGMVISPTYGMLKDSTLRTFKEISGDAIRDFNKNEMIAYMRNGAEILFRSADDPERLRGANLNWIWIDEGGLTRKDTYNIAIGRLRASGELGRLWVTTTPKGKGNWVYDASQNMTVYRATTLENPYVSEDWKDSLLSTYTGNFLRQEVYGEFVSFEGLVYSMFDASKHVKVMDIRRYTSFGLGIDEGYTNPAVILKIYQDNDENYYVAEEYYKTGKLQSEIVKQALRMADHKRPDIVVDSSAAGLIADLRDTGLSVQPRTGRVLEGIKKLQELIAKDKIIINPECVSTISDMESYMWKEGKDEPVKEFDHAPDALRYFITNKKRNLVAEQKRY